MKISVTISSWRFLTLFALLCGYLPLGIHPSAQDTPVIPQEASESTGSPAVSEPEQPNSDGSQEVVTEASQPSNAVTNEDVAAIRTAIDSYVKAFNAADAKALAEHFTEEGELATPSGSTMRGRSELAAGFTSFFEESPQAKLELVSTHIDQISPGVAIESGIARVIVPEEGPSETVYEAVHVKTDQGWKIDRSRDDESSQSTFSNHEQLDGLGWMIGTWVDQGDASTIKTTSRWTKNGNFIIRSFKVNSDEGIDFEGTQIVGWDPYAETIRSWTFDSDGGFAVGRWSVDGSRWTVRSLSVLNDGRRGSATHLYDVIGDDAIEFSSIGRQVDGELLPSIKPVRVVREAN